MKANIVVFWQFKLPLGPWDLVSLIELFYLQEHTVTVQEYGLFVKMWHATLANVMVFLVMQITSFSQLEPVMESR